MKEFNVEKAAKAQRELQKEKNYPPFAPSDGNCYSCRMNIYKEIVDRWGYKRGIHVERAATELITGCPHCSRSYCD